MTEELVERVAKAIYMRWPCHKSWERETEEDREDWRDYARAAIGECQAPPSSSVDAKES